MNRSLLFTVLCLTLIIMLQYQDIYCLKKDNVDSPAPGVGNITALPKLINTDMTLTKENSPYYVERDVTVAANVVLTINEGVEIMFKGEYRMTVFGGVIVNGSKEKPAIFKPDVGVDFWGWLVLDNPTEECCFTHLNFIDGRIFIIYDEPSEVEIVFDNLTLENNNRELVKDHALFISDHCNIIVRNSLIKGNGTGDGVIIQNASALVENSVFDNVPDAVELNGVTNGKVLNNIITDSNDDGVDLNGSTDILIKGNIIVNAADKGLSIGWDWIGVSTGIHVERNIIVGCAIGASFKDNTSALVINNTFYNNEITIYCGEIHEGQGGVNIEVKNTIFAGSKNYELLIDAKSTAAVSYCLSDVNSLPGENNLLAKPGFISAERLNFRLTAGSPCIDSGDPDSPADPDGGRTDIGAFSFDHRLPRIVINEINYHSALDFDSGDWVELYNTESSFVDISGWLFAGGSESDAFVIPYGVIIDSSSYIVLCRDSAKFLAAFPEVKRVIGAFEFDISDDGDALTLHSADGRLVDSVVYGDAPPWPAAADGLGPTLELISPKMDNNLPESWMASDFHGTPEMQNSKFIIGVKDNPIVNCRIELIAVSTNHYDETVRVAFRAAAHGSVSIEIYDILGRLILKAPTENAAPGENTVEIDCAGTPQGRYYLIVRSERDVVAGSLIILR